MPLGRVRTTFTGTSGAPWLSTLMFEMDGSQAEADAANTAVGSFWGAVDAQMVSAVTWTTEPYVDVLTPDGTLIESYSVTQQAGSGSQTTFGMLPAMAQALIRLNTLAIVQGNRLRGKIYVPGLTEAANSSNAVESATAAAIQTAVNTLISSPSTVLTVWSRTYDTYSNVQTATVAPRWATLRSRNV